MSLTLYTFKFFIKIGFKKKKTAILMSYFHILMEFHTKPLNTNKAETHSVIRVLEIKSYMFQKKVGTITGRAGKPPSKKYCKCEIRLKGEVTSTGNMMCT